MTERMSDERLAEIDGYVAALIEDEILDVEDALAELLQALKAERDRVNFLWEKIKSFAAQCKKHKNYIEELEAERIKDKSAWDKFYAVLKAHGYVTVNELVDRNIELQRKYEALVEWSMKISPYIFAGEACYQKYRDELRALLEDDDE